MFFFLRRRRFQLFSKNGTLTYFLYAIGEVVLVVVGILIAVYIDDLNEREKLQRQEIASYQDILNDLRKDSIQFAALQYRSRLCQNAFYHTYYEIQGERTFSDTIVYDFIGATQTFSPRTEDNHQRTIETLTNQNVRDELNAYFITQYGVSEAIVEYNDIILGKSRKFLFDEGIVDPARIFHDNMYGFFPTEGGLINYKALATYFDSKDFLLMLAELRLAKGRIIVATENLQSANAQLIKNLEKKLAEEA